eukprot:2458379-Rhodomonas_salina.1
MCLPDVRRVIVHAAHIGEAHHHSGTLVALAALRRHARQLDEKTDKEVGAALRDDCQRVVHER